MSAFLQIYSTILCLRAVTGADALESGRVPGTYKSNKCNTQAEQNNLYEKLLLLKIEMCLYIE